MIYDDDTSRRVHLRLPLEGVEELAAGMIRRPTRRTANVIARAVERRAEGTNRRKVSPSRVTSDLSYANVAVTVEQVAWVMVTARRRRFRRLVLALLLAGLLLALVAHAVGA